MLETFRSQTGGGVSKRVLAVTSAILALGVIVLKAGRPEASEELARQSPAISEGLASVVEGLLVAFSAGMAVWSRVQDRR